MKQFSILIILVICLFGCTNWYNFQRKLEVVEIRKCWYEAQSCFVEFNDSSTDFVDYGVKLGTKYMRTCNPDTCTYFKLSE